MVAIAVVVRRDRGSLTQRRRACAGQRQRRYQEDTQRGGARTPPATLSASAFATARAASASSTTTLSLSPKVPIPLCLPCICFWGFPLLPSSISSLNLAGKLGFWLPLAKLSYLSQVSNWVCGFLFLKRSVINLVDWVLSFMDFFFWS